MVTEIAQENLEKLNGLIKEGNSETKVFAIFSENDNSYIDRIIIGHNNGTMTSNVLSELLSILIDQLDLPLESKLKIKEKILKDLYNSINKELIKYT